MGNFNDMQKKVTDDELEKVSGGNSLEEMLEKLNKMFGIKKDILDACKKTDEDN